MSRAKGVFAAFTGDEILRESGRLPYPILDAFVRAGYEVRVFDNLRRRLTEFYKCEESSLPPTARLTLGLHGIEFTDTLPTDTADFIYLFDSPLASARRRPWRKTVKVGLDLFSPYRLRAPIIAPYSMHPAQIERASPESLRRLRCSARSLRVLFAGDSKGYVREWVRYPQPKLPRLEVLNTIKDRLPDDLVAVGSAEDLERLCASGPARRFVLSDSGTGIDPAQWLPTLARADFFLCPPGMVMPMCHNVIEAMAVGTIPLISYPEWLHPNLEHLGNCIVFDGKDDLIDKMRMTLSMPDSQVEAMRSKVIDYYESHLGAEVLVRKIEEHADREVTLLIYSELNVAKRAAQLDGNSVLIRGPGSDGPFRWLGRAIDKHFR